MPIKTLPLLLFALLASCGFQLRGSMPMADLEQIYVSDRVDIRQMIDQPVSHKLTSDLESVAGQVLNSPSAGVAGIVITNEQVIERSLSLSPNLLNRQIEIEKRVDYQILDSAGEILLADRMTARRELTESQSTPGAKDQERQLLLASINADLSRQLIYQLDAMLNGPQDATDE